MNMQVKTTVTNQEVAVETASHLINTGAYLLDFSRPQEDWFVWKSGIVAPVYCNCRKLFSDGNALKAVGKMLTEVTYSHFQNVQLITGLATAGIPWATIVATNLGLPISYVRSQAKGHGVGAMVEGSPTRGVKTVVIDDLCGSGESVRKAIDSLHEEFDLDVVGVLTITNWQFDAMWRNFADLNIPILSLTCHLQIVQEALNRHVIDSNQADKLLKFYDNPKAYNWE